MKEFSALELHMLRQAVYDIRYTIPTTSKAYEEYNKLYKKLSEIISKFNFE